MILWSVERGIAVLPALLHHLIPCPRSCEVPECPWHSSSNNVLWFVSLSNCFGIEVFCFFMLLKMTWSYILFLLLSLVFNLWNFHCRVNQFFFVSDILGFVYSLNKIINNYNKLLLRRYLCGINILLFLFILSLIFNLLNFHCVLTNFFVFFYIIDI